MPDRLTLASLASIPADVAKPGYDPAGVKVGVLHLGLGAFHRAHQAVYTDDILAADPRWGICGVCPGPAIAGLGAGNWPVAVTLIGMAIGAYAQGRVADRRL